MLNIQPRAFWEVFIMCKYTFIKDIFLSYFRIKHTVNTLFITVLRIPVSLVTLPTKISIHVA